MRRGYSVQHSGHVVVVELGAVAAVEQIEAVILYKAYQAVGIVGRRGIARGLQAPSPAAVVGGLVDEQRVVTRLFVEKLRVVVVYPVARPVALALYAEVVVRSECQRAVAAVRLQYTLRHGNAGRYAVTLHVVYGQRLVAGYVLLLGLSGLCGCCCGQQERRNPYKCRTDCCISNYNHYICIREGYTSLAKIHFYSETTI